MQLQTFSIVQVLNVPLLCSVTLRDSSCNHGNWNRFPPVYREAFRCHGNRSTPACTGVFMLLRCWGKKTLWVFKVWGLSLHSPSENYMKSLSSYLKSLPLRAVRNDRHDSLSSGDMFISWVSLPVLVVGVSWLWRGRSAVCPSGGNRFLCSYFVVWRDRRGRVGVKHKDWYTLLSAGRACGEISWAYFCFYRSKRFDSTSERSVV